MTPHYTKNLKVTAWCTYCNGQFTMINAHLKLNALKAFKKIDPSIQLGDVFKSVNKCTSPVVDALIRISETEFKYDTEKTATQPGHGT